MNKEQTEIYLKSIESEVKSYFELLKRNSSFQYYRQIVFGCKNVGKDEYVIKFGLFTDSKSIRHKVESIIDNCNIPKKEVVFSRILQKKYHPTFLNGFSVGSSIGAKIKNFGTLGLFAEDQNSEKGFISCGHVLPNSDGGKWSKVYSPGYKLFNNKVKVGDVLKTYPPVKVKKNEIDAAFAKIETQYKSSVSNILTIDKFKGKKLNILSHDIELDTDEEIYKIGAKSMLRSGINGGIEIDVVVNGNYTFEEVILIDETKLSLALGGDSGGPAFIERGDELYCIGIVMAKQYIRIEKSIYPQMQVLVCPINKILNQLNLKHI